MIPNLSKINIGINFLERLNGKGIRCELSETSNKKAKGILKTIRKYKWFRNNSYPLEIILRYKGLKNNVVYLKSGNGKSHTKAKLVTALNPKLAYLLGAMRDGTIMQNSGMHWVRIYDNLNSQWIENVNIPLFKEVFEVNLHLRKTKSAKYCDISNKPLLLQLKLIVNNNLHGDVPQAIKDAEFDIVRYYIRGFFDAEGYVGKRKNVIMFSQMNRNALEFIKKTLEKNKISCGKIIDHRLPIYNKENVSNFFGEIGSSNQSKFDRLVNLTGAHSLEKLSRG